MTYKEQTSPVLISFLSDDASHSSVQLLINVSKCFLVGWALEVSVKHSGNFLESHVSDDPW